MNTTELIQNFIRTELINDNNIKLEDTEPLIESGIIDSLGIMKLIMYLEESFKIKIEADDLMPENLGTVNAISSLIQEKLDNK